MKKHILLSFLLGVIVLLSGVSAGAAEAEKNTENQNRSGINLTADGSYVQGSSASGDNYNQPKNASTEIPLRSGLNAYFSFKGPALRDFIEKASIYNERLNYSRALFGFNIAF